MAFITPRVQSYAIDDLLLSPQFVQTHYDQPQEYDFTANTARGTAKKIGVLDTTITPRRSDSKILITLSVSYETSTDAEEHYYAGAFYLIRRVGGVGTEIGSAAAAGTRSYGFASFDFDYDGASTSTTLSSLGRSYLDSPATTNPVTYELWAYATSPTRNIKLTINRTRANADATWNHRTTSQMILQEYF